MRLLVTGGCGFLGSHFMQAWLARFPKDTIANVDCLTYAGSLDNVAAFSDNPRYSHHRVDLADEKALASPWDVSCDLVVHFAAETHVDRSLEDAGRFVRTNVLGTQNLLSLARDNTSASIILISSDEVYGPTPKGAAFGTGEPLRPSSPYAASKAAADWLGLAHRRTYETDLTIIRSVNVYGPRQYPEKFIPLAIVKALSAQSIPLYGHGRQRRTWLHVDDFIEGVIAIAVDTTKRSDRPVWHLGSKDEFENREIAAAICELCGADLSLLKHVPDRPGHDQRYALDYSQTERIFGWAPKVSFTDGLRKTVEWYRNNPDWVQRRLGWTPEFLRS